MAGPFDIVDRFNRMPTTDPDLELAQDNISTWSDELGRLFVVTDSVNFDTTGEVTIEHNLGREPIAVIPALPTEEISYKVVSVTNSEVVVEVNASVAGSTSWLLI